MGSYYVIFYNPLEQFILHCLTFQGKFDEFVSKLYSQMLKISLDSPCTCDVGHRIRHVVVMSVTVPSSIISLVMCTVSLTSLISDRAVMHNENFIRTEVHSIHREDTQYLLTAMKYISRFSIVRKINKLCTWELPCVYYLF